jgi:hypothetical protein
VTSLRPFVRWLPALAALLVLSVQPAGITMQAHSDAVVASHERNTLPSRHDDLVTRKQRHAASLEEYFAVDDDPDQFANQLPRLACGFARCALVVAGQRQALPCCRHVPLSHSPCAAPPTGPPHA